VVNDNYTSIEAGAKMVTESRGLWQWQLGPDILYGSWFTYRNKFVLR